MKIQSYLISDSLVKEEQQLLFSMRTQSFPVKKNFRYKYQNDLECRACNKANRIECETHFCESCITFQDERQGEILNLDDIFGPLEIQIAFVRKFKILARKWKLLLETSI